MSGINPPKVDGCVLPAGCGYEACDCRGYCKRDQARPKSSAGPLRTDAAQRLAEHVLSMDMITEKGIRARDLARAVLVSHDDLMQALWLIRHATSPQPDDGGHHENAYGLACAAIARATGATP